MWYVLIIIGFLGQIMIQGTCIIDEVSLLLIGVYPLFAKVVNKLEDIEDKLWK